MNDDECSIMCDALDHEWDKGFWVGLGFGSLMTGLIFIVVLC